jgi:hypothetical protein
LYNVTEYQYQQLKNYYPNCSVVAEIGRQPLKEESPTTDVQQTKPKMCPVHKDSLEQDENGTYYCVNAKCTYPMFHADQLL